VTRLITLIVMMGVLSACSSNEYKNSDHHSGGRFYNHADEVPHSRWAALKWIMTRKPGFWPEWRENTNQPVLAGPLKAGELSATFINHATFLLQIKNINCLTDPIFSERASPFSWLGPKRVRAPGLLLKDLPHIDCVVISHNHYDHMDKNSIHDLAEKDNPIFIVPLGNANLVKSFGAHKVVELDWWQQTPLPDGETTVTLVPAQHWSARGLFDRNQALWGGFVIRSPSLKIYFAGDTGYGNFFSDIKKKLGPMDVSFLPIGAYLPKWLMQHHHMNPEEAVQAHVDLGSQLSLAMHFGTFQLSDEGIDDPVRELQVALEKRGFNKDRFQANSNGKTIK